MAEKRFPRTRGDRPRIQPLMEKRVKVPPHTRG